LHQRAKLCENWSICCCDIAIFSDFEDGGRRHLGFSKLRNVIGLSLVVGQLASPCQISLNSVERLLRYGDLAVFKMAAVRHLGFVGPYLGHPR